MGGPTRARKVERCDAPVVADVVWRGGCGRGGGQVEGKGGQLSAQNPSEASCAASSVGRGAAAWHDGTSRPQQFRAARGCGAEQSAQGMRGARTLRVRRARAEGPRPLGVVDRAAQRTTALRRATSEADSARPRRLAGTPPGGGGGGGGGGSPARPPARRARRVAAPAASLLPPRPRPQCAAALPAGARENRPREKPRLRGAPQTPRNCPRPPPLRMRSPPLGPRFRARASEAFARFRSARKPARNIVGRDLSSGSTSGARSRRARTALRIETPRK